MSYIGLSKDIYQDKVYGCWLGKNAGGTLGGPLERIFGQEEMFDVWWYPKLTRGGIPNDDLEIQLVWLQVLRDRGIFLTARDLAEYWLDCISYNPDEYGLHKTNLRKGLQPPISGWYNNWFKDCMGSPIRSEIWACIAPGAPDIAAKYAYQDAICDHAGGESVYGEIFNATMESAAFLINDRQRLLEIGLSMIPESCLTYKAIRAAIRSYIGGLNWKEARQHVKEVVYNPVAQFSPINLGFQTIGLLYGQDFGDAMCKAVNCGWDTDCTGATVGAIWGILNGKKGLSKKWTKPLGDKVLVSKGIRNLQAPSDLKELTNEVCSIGEKVLVSYDAPVRLCDINEFTNVEDLFRSSTKEIKKLWKTPPNRVDFDLVTVKASIIYPDGPAALPDVPKPFKVVVENMRPEVVDGIITVLTPCNWKLEPSGKQDIRLQPQQKSEIMFSVKTSAGNIDTSNTGTVEISLNKKPSMMRLPLIFVGGFRWLVSNVFRKSISLDTKFQVEKDACSMKPDKGWKPVSWSENTLEIEPLFDGQSGILYIRQFIFSPDNRNAILGVPNNSKMRLWLNGEMIHETKQIVPLRPNYSGDGSNYATAILHEGWNHIMIKMLREEKPVKAHFTIAYADGHHGMVDIVQCRFPWE